MKRKIVRRRQKIGRGLLNGIINKIPVEMHMPGYQYCGPGTNLKKRLARGDPGINPLDAACKRHDIIYDKYPSGKERYDADKVLASEAWKRVKAMNSGLNERSAALVVAGAMRAKMGIAKVGRGMSKCSLNKKKKKKKKKKEDKKKTQYYCTFNDLVKVAKNAVNKSKPENIFDAVKVAVKAAKKFKQQKKVAAPRIIPIPKIGGALPLIPIFAGLSAFGTLVGGTTGVIRAVGAANEAKKQLSEKERHNKMMETIALGRPSKTGHGLYLKPYKNGLGLYMKSNSKNF
jgi:hypothetical protein